MYFLSRVLGFVRTILTYQKLSRLEADLLSNADKIPTLIATIFLMGTIFSSVLPVVSRLEMDSRQKVNRYLSIITLTVAGFLVVGLGLCAISMEPLLELITSQSIIQKANYAGLWSMYILTARVALVIPLNFGIQAITGVLLNFNKRFLVFSLAGTIANFGSLAGLFLANGEFIKVLIGMVIGSCLSSLLYIWACLKMDYKFNWQLFHPQVLMSEIQVFGAELKQTLKMFLPRLLLIDGFIIANLMIGKISTSSGQAFAFETAASIQSTFLIVITSLGMVFFPDLSRTLNDKSLGVMIFWEKLSKYLKTAIWLGIVISLLSTFGSQYVMKLFEMAGKGQDNAKYIVLLAQISSFRLFFQAIKEILDKYLYAKEKQWEPMWLSLLSVLGQLIVFCILWIMEIDAGILAMLVLTSYYMVWCVLAMFVVRRDYLREIPNQFKIYKE